MEFNARHVTSPHTHTRLVDRNAEWNSVIKKKDPIIEIYSSEENDIGAGADQSRSYVFRV